MNFRIRYELKMRANSISRSLFIIQDPYDIGILDSFMQVQKVMRQFVSINYVGPSHTNVQ
jgi:hypothetical protein